MDRRNFLRAGLIGLLAAPAQAQFGKLKPPKIPGVKMPEVDGAQFIKHTPPLTTNLADVYEAIPGLDDWEPTDAASLTFVPRDSDGDYLILPGLFEVVAESFCLKAGSNPPSRNRGNYGFGYLYAPLKGPKAGQIERILTRSEDHPEIPQHEVQVLLWAIIAEQKLSECPKEVQSTARVLLDEKDRRALENDALAVVPPQLRGKVYGSLPPLVRDGLEAENKMRALLAEKFAQAGDSAGELVDSVSDPGHKVSALYAQMESVAMRVGDLPEPATEKEKVPWGRWSWHPDGFFVRILPSGYATTKRQLYYPEKFTLRDGEIAGPDGIARKIPGVTSGSDAKALLALRDGLKEKNGPVGDALARAALSAMASGRKVALADSAGRYCGAGGFGSGGGGGAGMGGPGTQRLGQSRKPKENPNIERARNATNKLQTFGGQATKGLNLPFFMTDRLLNWQYDMASAIDRAMNGESTAHVNGPGGRDPEPEAACGPGGDGPGIVALPRPKLVRQKMEPVDLLAPRQALSGALVRLCEVGRARLAAETRFSQSPTAANGLKLVALRRLWGLSQLAVADAGDALQAVYEKNHGSDAGWETSSWQAYSASLASGPTSADRADGRALGLADAELDALHAERRRQAAGAPPEGGVVESFKALCGLLRDTGSDYARLPAAGSSTV